MANSNILSVNPLTDDFNTSLGYTQPWYTDYGVPNKCKQCPPGYAGNICCTSSLGGKYVQAHLFNNDVWTVLMDSTSPFVSEVVSYFQLFEATK
jgi:hypothetical protein